MSRSKKPWWSPTRTRGQSLAFGLLLVVMTVLQVVTTLLTEDATWWQWALAVLMLSLAVYYLSAWGVRGRREVHPASE